MGRLPFLPCVPSDAIFLIYLPLLIPNHPYPGTNLAGPVLRRDTRATIGRRPQAEADSSPPGETPERGSRRPGTASNGLVT